MIMHFLDSHMVFPQEWPYQIFMKQGEPNDDLLPFLFFFLILSTTTVLAQGPRCDEDIILINDQGCASPCCIQDPPGSGNYVFLHDAVEKIDIRGNTANVVSVSFPNLVSVEKSIRISFNQPGAITSISFPSLQSAGLLEIQNNTGLQSVDLPRLMVLENEDGDANLRIQSNVNLQIMHLPLLGRVSAPEAGSAYVQIRYNHALDAIDLPMLRMVAAGDDFGEAYVFISDNDGAHSVSMNNLQRLSAGTESISYLIVDDMVSMTELSFPKLQELLPTGGPSDFSELTVGHSPQLTDFVFPSLERVSLVQLSGLEGTRRAMFPKLSELQYLWVFRSCEDAFSTLKIYLCGDETLMDLLLNNDDGLCGAQGYMLTSVNPENTAACDASDVCQSFVPESNECKCNSPGLCTVENP